MSYVALYRTYRPKAFKDVAGQKVIVKTLKNALLHDKIAHAYIFSGPRGTGKTSIAKILAKAVNCEKRPIDDACNECATCKGIDSNDINDVIEIDAASNNGVDEIRELIDKVKYAPSVGKYKVYIIDEVHMLTTGAFNALLKTLEEPPKHAIFILATTEVHKIPGTILSRCQRFDFKNIEVPEIVGKLKEICKKEKIDISDDAIKAISYNAEGGLRDALSLLDQVISYADKKITEDDVHQVSGSLSKKNIIDILDAIIDKNTEKVMTLVDELLLSGKEVTRVINDLLIALKDILVEKNNIENKSGFTEISKKMTFELIYFYVNILTDLQQDIKWTQQKRTYLEIAVIKMMKNQILDQIEQIKQIKELEKRITDFENKVDVKKPVKPIIVNNSDKKPLVTVSEIEEILNNASKEKKAILQSGWERLKNHPDPEKELVATLIHQCSLEATTETKMLLVFDDIATCKKLLEPETKEKVLEIFNAKSKLIDDYIVILKNDWVVLKDIYLDLYKKGHKKPKLPPHDLKLYEDNNNKMKYNDDSDKIVDLAIEYFGKDKVVVKD